MITTSVVLTLPQTCEGDLRPVAFGGLGLVSLVEESAHDRPMSTAFVSSPSSTIPRKRLWRSRWAAIGAAVAVTLGAGGLFHASAASTPSSLVSIAPVRLLDTRDGTGLSGPFVSDTARKLDVAGVSVDGSVVVPDGATGIVANVTVVEPSTLGFVSVRPGDATGMPSTSSLNFMAGTGDAQLGHRRACPRLAPTPA